ncbi:MAG: ABC-F family ATP-binding cassette domain-containing protein [Candidatus Thalassarchaeaceae archaeon]|nr:ABC-F family ATP-binding cassette domain-containing protein [Candidatus Thalassarchaeaceae archaeon]MDP6318882.1 ABC-F family ATP-binding cassette domain-containing protein [Candidatus Thalassarchaeaceae archaeon]
MRELIRLEDVHRSFGPVKVLEGVNLRIDEGDNIGVVGHNGAGKTTLLRTISNQDQDIGDITFAPGLRLAFLTQVRDIDEGATLEQELNRRGRQFQELEEEISALEMKMATPSFYDGEWQGDMDRYQELQAMMARSGGTNVASHAQEILKALDLAHHPLEMPLADLSGGERAKVALARQLVGLSEIDVFFLDEPTNHLDLATLDWLEGFLKTFEGALLIVSHDRYFLDRVCNAVVEIQDTHSKGYQGNYSSFIQQKELFLQTLSERIDKTSKEVKRLKGAMTSMKRANKYDKSISQKHFMLMRAQRELRWLKSLKPRQRRGLNFSLKSTEKSSLEVLDFRNASLTFEGLNRPILNSLEVGVSRAQKIGIVGPNGAGKTSLLRIINGELELDEGIIDVKPGVQIGYFHQDHRSLNFDLTPVEQVRALKPRMDYGDIRALLGRFQFTTEMVETKLSKLSGGERARIAMLKLLLEDNNLLLLDEPTNHLDTDAKEALEEALQEYEGSIITVSHDRWFLDKVCDTIWELPGDGSMWIWPGNYTDFIRLKRKNSD